LTVDPAGVDVPFTCPAGRDATEVGGRYSLYVAPSFNEDSAQPITCTLL
jgi:hypothetical protein